MNVGLISKLAKITPNIFALFNLTEPDEGSALVGHNGSTVRAALENLDQSVNTLNNAAKNDVDHHVPTMAAMKNLLKTGPKSVILDEYYEGAGYIGTRYKLREDDEATLGNDFTVVVADDGGRWILKHADAYTLKMAGGREDGVSDDYDAWVRLLNVSQGKLVEWERISVVSKSVVIPVNTLRLQGRTPMATILAMDGTNFEYTLSAVGKSRIEYKDFSVNANKVGRLNSLTVRSVAVSMVNCTDCNLYNVRGIGALGFNGIPGIGISTAGGGFRINTTNCTASDCGVAGRAADGFFCSSNWSVNTGNVSIDCTDTGHVIESCSYSGIVGCVSIRCGVLGAISNATSLNRYGNYIQGLTGEDWSAGVTGGVQIGVFGSGDLIDTKVSGLSMVGVTSFLGPGVNVRRTGTGRVNGLDLACTIRNAGTQGIVVDSAIGVIIRAQISGTNNACIQFQGDCVGCQVLPGTKLLGGTFGVIATGTSQVIVQGIEANGNGTSSYGIYAFDTAKIVSIMNTITGVNSGREGKDANAILERITIISGFLSIDTITAGAPLNAVSSKMTILNRSGNVAGVVGLSTS